MVTWIKYILNCYIFKSFKLDQTCFGSVKNLGKCVKFPFLLYLVYLENFPELNEIKSLLNMKIIFEKKIT